MKRSMAVVVVLIVAVASAPPDSAGLAPPLAPAALAGTSRFVAIDPIRAGDTRLGIGIAAGAITAGSELELDLSASVPAGASAAALNVTLVDSFGAGYATVFAAGAARPATSNLNVDGPAQTVANAAIVPLAGTPGYGSSVALLRTLSSR